MAASVTNQTIIAVRDVRASSRWYAHVLGADAMPDHEHRSMYDRLYCGDNFVLQLHAWGEHDHPNLVHPAEARPGNGVLLWFQVTDFDDAVERAHSLGADVLQEPRVNPRSGARELWLRDPDGYVIVLASADGEPTAE